MGAWLLVAFEDAVIGKFIESDWKASNKNKDNGSPNGPPEGFIIEADEGSKLSGNMTKTIYTGIYIYIIYWYD